MKKEIDYIQAHSLRSLLDGINKWNQEHPKEAILKEDIVQIMTQEGTYILLYYRTSKSQ